jgi:hypothetical protein
MDRNILYAIVGVLAVAVVVLGLAFQHEREKTTGFSIETTKNGISIEHKER